jgi:hypothetical protein
MLAPELKAKSSFTAGVAPNFEVCTRLSESAQIHPSPSERLRVVQAHEDPRGGRTCAAARPRAPAPAAASTARPMRKSSRAAGGRGRLGAGDVQERV